ncbi:MAG: hypothetical protein ACPKPY_12715 [Nitrososphaeraceae archaeon]
MFWIYVGPVHKSALETNISIDRNMFVPEQFIRSRVEKYGKILFILMVKHSIDNHLTLDD